MGEYEAAYSQITSDHSTMLLSACDNDMDAAYKVWTDVLIRLEKRAKKSDLDINGLKIWINFFWSPDGSVDHITFFPKPTSKNIDFEELKTLLMDLSEGLYIDLSEKDLSSGVAHYGSASFPIFHQFHQAVGN